MGRSTIQGRIKWRVRRVADVEEDGAGAGGGREAAPYIGESVCLLCPACCRCAGYRGEAL